MVTNMAGIKISSIVPIFCRVCSFKSFQISKPSYLEKLEALILNVLEAIYKFYYWQDFQKLTRAEIEKQFCHRFQIEADSDWLQICEVKYIR